MRWKLFVGCLLSGVAAADPPMTMAYQGRVANPLGEPLTGAFDVAVSLHASESAPAAQWEELHLGVPVESGALALALGSVTPFPEGLFADGPLWLGVAVDGFAGPRTPLRAVPSAHTGYGLAALSAPPVPCTAPAVGRLYFDTAVGAVQVCDGEAWFPLGAAALGSASSRAAESCLEIVEDQPNAGSGLYWIDVNGTPIQLYCDMTPGDAGWTLVGQMQGRHDVYSTWLRTHTRTENLQSLAIESSTWSSVDAVDLAVNHATQARLSNSNLTRWARWPLPAGRTVGAFWNVAAGYDAIQTAASAGTTVTVTGWNGSGTCHSNSTGIMPLNAHGASYPGAFYNAAGNTTGTDWCMAVGVMLNRPQSSSVHGFYQQGNGFDAPSSETTWPDGSINIDPRVSVWLR